MRSVKLSRMSWSDKWNMGSCYQSTNQLSGSTLWLWQPEHEQAWTRRGLQDALSSEPVLQYYNPKKEVCVSSDASKDSLEAVILQKKDAQWIACLPRAAQPACLPAPSCPACLPAPSCPACLSAPSWPTSLPAPSGQPACPEQASLPAPSRST